MRCCYAASVNGCNYAGNYRPGCSQENKFILEHWFVTCDFLDVFAKTGIFYSVQNHLKLNLQIISNQSNKSEINLFFCVSLFPWENSMLKFEFSFCKVVDSRGKNIQSANRNVGLRQTKSDQHRTVSLNSPHWTYRVMLKCWGMVWKLGMSCRGGGPASDVRGL